MEENKIVPLKRPDKSPAEMTLQEKFIKLREAVPTITKKQHSDSVKYTFAKINDIYELLTPAMNEWGVNFDIIGEEATRHDANGDAIYYHSYQQQTKNGGRTVWVYEADIVIRWTNADKPDDIQDVKLHAIGTNDSGPDKAKGSAWTYCLKYYLFEKLGIDQGEDDPDMKDNSGTVQRNNGGKNGQNGSGKANGQGGQKNLSEAQMKRLYSIGGNAGYAPEQIHEYIAKKYKQPNPYQMNKAQYDELCNYLDGLAKNKGGK